MVESGDYFFFAMSPNESVTAFRSEIGQEKVAGLSTNLRRIQRSTTTDTQYQRALARFRKRPDPVDRAVFSIQGIGAHVFGSLKLDHT
jgi:hypothetical protein